MHFFERICLNRRIFCIGIWWRRLAGAGVNPPSAKTKAKPTLPGIRPLVGGRCHLKISGLSVGGVIRSLLRAVTDCVCFGILVEKHCFSLDTCGFGSPSSERNRVARQCCRSSVKVMYWLKNMCSVFGTPGGIPIILKTARSF